MTKNIFHKILKHVDKKRSTVLAIHFLLKTHLFFPQQLDSALGLQNVDKVSRSTLCTPKFKLEGNGKQYEFNAPRRDEVSRAKEFLR